MSTARRTKKIAVINPPKDPVQMHEELEKELLQHKKAVLVKVLGEPPKAPKEPQPPKDYIERSSNFTLTTASLSDMLGRLPQGVEYSQVTVRSEYSYIRVEYKERVPNPAYQTWHEKAPRKREEYLAALATYQTQKAAYEEQMQDALRAMSSISSREMSVEDLARVKPRSGTSSGLYPTEEYDD